MYVCECVCVCFYSAASSTDAKHLIMQLTGLNGVTEKTEIQRKVL